MFVQTYPICFLMLTIVIFCVKVFDLLGIYVCTCNMWLCMIECLSLVRYIPTAHDRAMPSLNSEDSFLEALSCFQSLLCFFVTVKIKYSLLYKCLLWFRLQIFVLVSHIYECLYGSFLSLVWWLNGDVL
jgi:hypothetical protein